MKPVERMTPAAKDLMTKKMFFSGLMAGIHLPRVGIQTPREPATRMEKIAASFNGIARDRWSSSSSASQLQSAWVRTGRRSRRVIGRKKEGFFMFNLYQGMGSVVKEERF